MDNSLQQLIQGLEQLSKGPAEKILKIQKNNWYPTAKERWEFFGNTIDYIISKYQNLKQQNQGILVNEYLCITNPKKDILNYCHGGGFLYNLTSAIHTLEWELYDFATKTKEEDFPVKIELSILAYREINLEKPTLQ